MLNSVSIIGRIGNDLEMRYTQGGEAVVSFNVACSEKYTDKQGNKQEKTEWIKIVVYGKRAEVCSKYLGKGSLVYVEGKLTTRKWQDKQGIDRYTTEIVARQVQFLDSKKDSQQCGYNESFPQDNSQNIENMPF